MPLPNCLKSWLSYLESMHPTEIDLSLDRIKILAERYFLTNFTAKVITVGGTNGKGSTVKCLESIYAAAGYRVAAYTSPHLLKFNERLRIQEKDIDDHSLLDAFAWVEKVRIQTLSFFEFTTLAALYHCQKLKLDVIILEIGLGGRLDAVNIVDSDISVITNIDLDHTQWLGTDRESIGFEKAGIIRSKQILVCGDHDPPKSLLAEVHRKEAFLYQCQQHFSWVERTNDWDWNGQELSYLNLPKPRCLLENAATALAVIEQLNTYLPVSLEDIKLGLQRVSLPGRFELLAGDPTVILDVAHNPPAMKKLAERLKKIIVRTDETSERKKTDFTVVFGMLADKDIFHSVLPLIPVVDHWYIADLNVKRGENPEAIRKILADQGVEKCYTFASVSAALESALPSGAKYVVVLGSFYTVAQAKELIHDKNYIKNLFARKGRRPV